MAALAPRCDVEVANFIKKNGAPFQLSLIFHEVNDFHPDHLIHKVPVLEKLFEARSAAGEPDRLAKILHEVGVSIATEEPSPVEEQVPEPETPDEVSRRPLKPGLPPSKLLDSIVEETPVDTAKGTGLHLYRDLARFVQEIVAPVADRTDYAAQDRVRGVIDEIIGGPGSEDKDSRSFKGKTPEGFICGRRNRKNTPLPTNLRKRVRYPRG